MEEQMPFKSSFPVPNLNRIAFVAWDVKNLRAELDRAPERGNRDSSQTASVLQDQVVSAFSMTGNNSRPRYQRQHVACVPPPNRNPRPSFMICGNSTLSSLKGQISTDWTVVGPCQSFCFGIRRKPFPICGQLCQVLKSEQRPHCDGIQQPSFEEFSRRFIPS